MKRKDTKRDNRKLPPLAASIIDSVPNPFVLLDTELRALTANRAFYRKFAATPEETIGRRLFEVGQVRWGDGSLQRTLEHVLSDDAVLSDLESKFEFDGGERRTMLVNTGPLATEAGRSPLIYLSIEDIHEEKHNEETLRTYKFSIDQAPDEVFWVNHEGSFSYVNEQACRSLGYTREEFEDLSLFDINPRITKDRWDLLWAQYQQDQIGSHHIETFHRRKDGTVFPVEVSLRHIRFGGIEFHVAFARDITERRQIEQTLELTQSTIDQASIACFWMDDNGQVIYVNDQACRSLGYSQNELLQKTGFDIDLAFTPEKCAACWQQLLQERVINFETTHQRKDGSSFPVEITSNYIAFGGKEYSCAYVRDITERKLAEKEKATLESQLRQAMKMESVGRLAGGVAHDFNNMLSVILGYTELIKGRLPNDDPLLREMLEIEKAANRSKSITSHLLAFSRKQIIAPRPLNLNDMISDKKMTFSRLIGEDVYLKFIPQKELWMINFDPSQVDQILVNLAVNACDAMPNGGNLTIKTENVDLDEAFCSEHIGCKPGRHVMLMVSDEGSGMDKDTLAQIFEPFFTTKDIDKGTGLGLSTVYGIIKQNNGFITVRSEPGQGTTFQIYLPGIMMEGRTERIKEAPLVSGTGTVFLVEDDDMLRRMTKSMLEKIGYTVLAPETPSQALSFFEEAETSFDLIITDVVMPGISGPELIARIESKEPGIKYLFMSGYTSDVIVHHGVLEEGVHFIQKPFSMRELALKVRDAIGND